MTEESAGSNNVAGRKATIVLGLVCVILAASLVGVIVIYLSIGASPSEVAALRTENTNLEGNVTSLTNQLTALQDSYVQLSSQLQSLQNQISANEELQNYTAELSTLLQLGASSVYMQNQQVQIDPNSTTTIISDVAIYAGYFSVQATSSSNTTYAQLFYTFSGQNFDNKVLLGEDGTGIFPILPGNFALVLGNDEASDIVNVTVSVTYVY